MKQNASLKGLNPSEYILELLSLSLSDDGFFNLESSSYLKDADEVKSHIVTTRLNSKDYNELLSKSMKAKMSISKYIKSAALNPDKEIIIYDGLKEFIHGISKLGNNINQLTILAHQGKISSVDLSEVKKLLSDIWTSLAELTKKNKSKRR